MELGINWLIDGSSGKYLRWRLGSISVGMFYHRKYQNSNRIYYVHSCSVSFGLYEMFYELENNKSDKRTSQASTITKLIYFYKIIKNNRTALKQRNKELVSWIIFRGVTKQFLVTNASHLILHLQVKLISVKIVVFKRRF